MSARLFATSAVVAAAEAAAAAALNRLAALVPYSVLIATSRSSLTEHAAIWSSRSRFCASSTSPCMAMPTTTPFSEAGASPPL